MEIGDVVAGRYALEDVLGRGGMATVYRAHDRVLERDVALKVLDQRLAGDPDYVERFRREARAIAKLSHPNIVTIIDRGQVDGCEFIVFELVRGANVKELLRARGPLPVGEALAIVHQAARGLAAAHGAGIVHRDVKPQNVLVDDDGVAKVTDFGIARSLASDEAVTLTGTILGTGDYLSPEQAVGHPADERSDQYSLGALLYELLTGEVPYAADSMLAVAVRHVNDPVPSVRERRRDLSPRVDALVARAMAKRREDRFPTMDALIAALEACMADERARAAPDGEATRILAPARPEAIPRPPRMPGDRAPARSPKRVPWALVAGLAVLTLGAGAVWALATGRFDPAENGGPGGRPVRLVAVADYDPPRGDGVEHPELLPAATDRDPTTYWRTETYDGGLDAVGKAGVGLVLDTRRPRALDELTIVSGTPGFTAIVRAGDSVDGEFVEVSAGEEVGERTTFDLDTGGRRYRYYLVWITRLDEVAHVNEITGR
ncbi:MAG TPA: protein kinase [Gaiellaceae bacterium]|nr:protein kinase [Gaiellaceae bacterium]